jgi:branched-chain amino acid transport system substrate-binding protein
MKKIFLFTMVCLMLLVSAVGCGGKNAAEEEGGPIYTAPPPDLPDTGDNIVKIGVFEPHSGVNGAIGKQEILGMQFANYETPTVELDGTLYRVDLVIADNKSDPAQAADAARELVSAGCSLVLGSYGSDVSIAASGVFGAAGIPVIGLTCTDPRVTKDNDHYYRICFQEAFQGTVLASFAKTSISDAKAYCLAQEGDEYSQSLCDYFMDSYGRENCLHETFPEETADFKDYFANAASAGAKVFFSPVSAENAERIISQAAAQEFDIPLLAGDTWDSPDILKAAKGKKLDIYVSTFYQEGGNAEFDAAIKGWINNDSQAKSNNGGTDKIAAVSAMGYDAYKIAVQALLAAGSTDPADVLAVLPRVTHIGIAGPIAFDGGGNAIRNMAYVKRCDPATAEWEFVVQQEVR